MRWTTDLWEVVDRATLASAELSPSMFACATEPRTPDPGNGALAIPHSAEPDMGAATEKPRAGEGEPHDEHRSRGPVTDLAASWQRDVDRMFRSMAETFGGSRGMTGGRNEWLPAADILTRGDDLVIRLELPGIDPERDAEITVEDATLHIRGAVTTIVPTS